MHTETLPRGERRVHERRISRDGATECDRRRFWRSGQCEEWKDAAPNVANLLTLLQTNSQVYVDIAGLIWSYPINEVNRYIERIVDAGFEDRVMFGTDQFIWPKLMAYSISIIQNADYLTPEQKRDILYNNAARFLRLDLVKK